MPSLRELVRLAKARLEDLAGIDPGVVGDAVHHHLADDGTDPMGLGGPKGHVRRLGPDRRIGDDRRRPRGGEGAERRGRRPRGRSFAVGTFERKDVPVEPRQEVEAAAETGVRQLRQVRVEVDEARQDDHGPQVHDPGWRRIRAPGFDTGDAAGRVDLDQSVVFVEHAAVRQRREQTCAQGERAGGRQNGHAGAIVHGGRFPAGLTVSEVDTRDTGSDSERDREQTDTKVGGQSTLVVLPTV